ncbi:hypothetical protein VTI74DRAFT_3799 [Chaetomium olivicolor]
MANIIVYESSSEDDGEEYDYDPEIILRSIDKSMTINFSIRANYTNWKLREAFRELVQNWRDGIIRAFHLAERDFCVIREEKTSGRSTEIVYKVPRLGGDDRKEWLGYIRFKGRDGEGAIDITNRSATLQPWHLDLGGTSKAGDVHQAGAHGEGLKIARLVLMRGRQNHSVRCRSGGFGWTFNFTTRGRLVARLRRMSPEAIHRVEDQAQRLSERTLLPFAANPKSDVQFFIGEAHTGRDEWGSQVKRSLVKREDFDAWTKASLFLHDARDGAIISTEDGDLHTDPQLCGHLYLKGLLLSESTATRSASITKEPLNANEEARAILAIWSRVLAAKPEMVLELSAMLNSTEPEYADISGAKRHMNFETASKTYNVADQTVRRRLAGQPARRDSPANSKKLTQSEEEAIVRYIIELSAQSFPPRLRGVEDMANQLLRARDAPPVGKLWAHNFVKREPELCTRYARRYDYQRAKCEDPRIIGEWFGLVRNPKAKYGIVDDDIYNFDETGFIIGMIRTAAQYHLANWYAECNLPANWRIATTENG